MKLIILFSLLLGFQTHAAGGFKLSKEKGVTHFLAIGNPSAIRIDGKTDGPEGILLAEDNGDSLLVAGELRVSLKNADTGIALRDRHMKDKYLETAKFENASLIVSEISVAKASLNKETPTTMPFKGILDLHGVKKDIQGELTVKSASEGIVVSAKFPVKLSDHGVMIPSFAGITVADQVEVTAQSMAERTQ